MNPLIIPIFLPHLGCRERCLFCNQKATTNEVPSPQTVREFIDVSLHRLSTHPGKRERQVAFYGGSFTAMSQEVQVSYLNEVQPFIVVGKINSIRLSTRPDALSEEALVMLKEYGVKTVEIGVQSMMDEVLLLSKRGHTAEDSASAILRLKHLGFEVGVHLMIGLPGDTCGKFLQSLDQIIGLKPDFVRIHPTLVLKGASLEQLWKSGEYSPMTMNEALEWLKRGILRLGKASIPVARIGLQPTKELEEHFLAGPFHPSLHQLVDSAIFYEMAEELLRKYPNGLKSVFACNPKDLSNLKGQKNGNILRLKKHFNLNDIFAFGREDVTRGRLVLQSKAGEVFIDRESFN
ncbi:MAG: radical SAM protein [Deltaproteobacteria bacterium]|nr:radical SAM protein [Deltaproteobacteria bacterium]MBM4347313.1 radical SAM protein [Deltaproteobacteria bacterium]